MFVIEAKASAQDAKHDGLWCVPSGGITVQKLAACPSLLPREGRRLPGWKFSLRLTSYNKLIESKPLPLTLNNWGAEESNLIFQSFKKIQE